jgi:hypothetical protein
VGDPVWFNTSAKGTARTTKRVRIRTALRLREFLKSPHRAVGQVSDLPARLAACATGASSLRDDAGRRRSYALRVGGAFYGSPAAGRMRTLQTWSGVSPYE